MQRRNTQKKKNLAVVLAIAAVVLLTVALIITLAGRNTSTVKKADDKNKAQNQETSSMQTVSLEDAEFAAKQYDYDKAIEIAKSLDSSDSDIQSKISEWETAKGSLVEYPSDKITHVFVHSLIYDNSLAFDGDAKQDGYNLVMTTVNEFNDIIDELYKKGYVLVNLHDIATFDSEGNLVDGHIYLPEGKKAMVLSQDDTCYYHSQEGDGIADKLIIDENGEVKNHYTGKNGEEIGDFDMVPIIDTFVKEHPDFSYHGHKGAIAVTGYNGVLGYRTDTVYDTRPEGEVDPDQQAFLDAHPDFDYQKECEEAKKVADKIKENGWEFASHSWGHKNYGSYDLELTKTDNEKFQERVIPIIGKTDILIFPNGTDIMNGIAPYDQDNDKFEYLRDYFRIYCTVDSAQYWLQKGPNYMRMGRRNLDGYRMYHNPELLEDLFDSKAILDKDRPLPVPDMSHYG